MKEEKKKGKLKGFLKKLWNKTDGWKTVAGVVLHAGWAGVHLSTKVVDLDTALWIHGGIGNLTGVGLGWKVAKYVKSPTGKKVIGIIGKALKIK